MSRSRIRSKKFVASRKTRFEALEDRRLLSSIFLSSGGQLNGQPVDSSNYWIEVEPGDQITGTIKTDIVCTNSPGAIVPYGYSATWGDRTTQPVESHRWLGPRTATLGIGVNKTAPTAPGEYYLPIAFSGSYTLAQVFSATHAGGTHSGVWYDGNDLGWDWTPAQFQQARDQGQVTQQMSLPSSPTDYITVTQAASWVGVRVNDDLAWQVIYETDFSSDPGWITNNPSRYDWDSSDETFYANEIQVNNDGYYAYYDVGHDGGDSFKLTWDVIITGTSYATGHSFGLYASNMYSDAPEGNYAMVSFIHDDAGRHVRLQYNADDGSSIDADYSLPARFSLNTWYHVEMTYDASAHTLSADIGLGKGSTSGDFAFLHLTNVGPFNADMGHIGTSARRTGTFQNPGGQAFGKFDNVVLLAPVGEGLVPDHGRIAFHSYEAYGDENSRISIWDFGSQQHYLAAEQTINDAVTHAMNPKFSSDGRYITFMAVDRSLNKTWRDSLDILVYDFLTDRPPVNLSEAIEHSSSRPEEWTDWIDEDPAFNPNNNSEIVFKRWHGGSSDLWIVTLDSSVENPIAVHKLTTTPEIQESGPVFSLDGIWVTYWTGADDDAEIRRGKLVEDGEKELTLAEEEVLLTDGAWYPAYLSNNELLYTKTSWHWLGQQDDVYAYNLQEQTTTSAAFNRGLLTAYPDENDAFKIGNEIIGFSSSREGLLFRNADIYFGTLTNGDICRLEASTDDLDDLGGAYNDMAVKPPGQDSGMKQILLSHADLHIYDPDGRHLGVNYDTAVLEEGIPGASFKYYEDDGDGIYLPSEERVPGDFLAIPTHCVQVATLPTLEGGHYRTELVGTSVGPFELVVEGWQEEELVSSETFAGEVIEGQRFVTSTTVMAVGGVLTLLSDPLNAVPMIVDIDCCPAMLDEDELVTLTGMFIDADSSDTHTATINWGDGATTPGVVNESDGSGTCEATHVYEKAGVYTVTLTVRDDHRESDSDTVTVAVSGLNLRDGLLQIVGTNENDHVFVKRVRHGQLLVFAGFLERRERFQRFDAEEVEQIDIRLYGGRDHATVGRRVDIPTYIDGGPGRDVLSGGSGHDILIGGEGRDRLFGHGGWDLLIGGLGTDLLMGGFGDDLLLAGTTAFDANDEALRKIMEEWTSGRDYGIRVQNIRGEENDYFEDRLNEDYFLVADGGNATVFDDDARDLLNGGRGQDWYFTNYQRDDDGKRDRVHGRRRTEFVDDLDLMGVE